jgi:hypothetical protein
MSVKEATQPEISRQKAFPNILVVPETNESTDYKSYSGIIKPGLKGRIGRNMDVLNASNFCGLNHKESKKAEAIRNLLNTAWNRYETALDGLWTSPDAIMDSFQFLDQSNVNHFPEAITMETSRVKVQRLEDFFRHFLEKSNGPTVVMSESHLTTTPLARVLKEANPDSKIGMFVFDTHLDTDPGPFDDTPTKGNTLRLLVDGDRLGKETVVEKIAVIGVPDRIEIDHRGRTWGLERYKGKINVVTEDELLGDDPHNMSFSKKAFDQILARKLIQMKQEGITNVLISFDLDVLKNAILGLTAMEYSVFHGLLYLSSLDLSSSINHPEEIYRLLTKNYSILDYPISLGSRGLSVPYAVHAIQSIQEACKAEGVEFGIKFKGSTVYGDIVELSGPDYMDQTKKAALEIARAMLP